MTNFPMWLKGDRTSPTLNYTVETRNGVVGLKDKVIYKQNGREKSIEGFDKPIDGSNTKYSWRGNGLLWLLESQWQILHYDKENQILLTHFDKTLFTPEGMDVISKRKKLTAEEIKKILAIVEELGFHNKPELIVINQE